MKNEVTKFDLEAAFRALDEIEIPATKGLKANMANLNEAFCPMPKTEMLVEEFYDINSQEDLEAASAEREAEVAKAKLARIEKIVDLNAESPEDIQPSYVGKTIIQCPQCMTLFYKDEADIVKSEEDPMTCNVGEACQHCGNTDGYTLAGKVGAVEPEEAAVAEEIPAEGEELPEVPAEETFEETPVEETTDEGSELTEVPTEEAPAEETAEEEAPVEEEEEKKEEAFEAHSGNVLAEQIENALESLNKSEIQEPVEKHNCSENDSENLTLNEEITTSTKDCVWDNINVLGIIPGAGDKISEEEKAAADHIFRLSQTSKHEILDAIDEAKKNNGKVIIILDDKVDSAIQARLDKTIDNFYRMESINKSEENAPVEKKHTSVFDSKNLTLNEEDVTAVEDELGDEVFDIIEKDGPATEADVAKYEADSDVFKEESFDTNILEDVDEESLEGCIKESLTNVYENIDSFSLTNCTLDGNKFIVEGLINFKSGTSKHTKYVFTEAFINKLDTVRFVGTNEGLANDGHFILNSKLVHNTELVTESFEYNYSIGESLVEGYTHR